MPTHWTILLATAKDVKGVLLRSANGAVSRTVVGGSFRHPEPWSGNTTNSDLIPRLKFYVAFEKHRGGAEELTRY
ncbi:MAG TPA: hypothetical protein VEC99_10925 [Clostridia bacterium]|nr:hypothetical protein [Clostridia bacterium]